MYLVLCDYRTRGVSYIMHHAFEDSMIQDSSDVITVERLFIIHITILYCMYIYVPIFDKDLLSLRYTVTRNYCKVKYHTVIH